MIVAIDGPAGTGKGTVAKLISERLDFVYIDTGAMYRCITLKMIRENISLNEEEKIKDLLERTKITFKNLSDKQHVYLDGEDVSDLIRKPNVNELVSPVSAIKIIRIKMVELQRKLGEEGNVIMEGRDITTVVFPNAEVKIYLTASSAERARRRYEELKQKGETCDLAQIEADIIKRDEQDMSRAIAPLKQAEDAYYLDSSNLTISEVVEVILNQSKEKGLWK